jgi:hypothetical protein
MAEKKTTGETVIAPPAHVSVEDAPVTSVTVLPEPITDERDGEQTHRPAINQLQNIRYAGPVDRKIVTAQALREAGVSSTKNDTDLEWNAANGFIVPVKEVNAETLDFLLANVPGISVD